MLAFRRSLLCSMHSLYLKPPPCAPNVFPCVATCVCVCMYICIYIYICVCLRAFLCAAAPPTPCQFGGACAGQRGVTKISMLASDVRDWSELGGYWRQKETYVRRWYQGMDLKFCQLDLQAVRHPSSSLTLAFHPECTIHTDTWHRILHNVISATAGVCLIATFNELEMKARGRVDHVEWAQSTRRDLVWSGVAPACTEVVIGVCQQLGRRAQCQRNPYYANGRRSSGCSACSWPRVHSVIGHKPVMQGGFGCIELVWNRWKFRVQRLLEDWQFILSEEHRRHS